MLLGEAGQKSALGQKQVLLNTELPLGRTQPSPTAPLSHLGCPRVPGLPHCAPTSGHMQEGSGQLASFWP